MYLCWLDLNKGWKCPLLGCEKDLLSEWHTFGNILLFLEALGARSLPIVNMGQKYQGVTRGHWGFNSRKKGGHQTKGYIKLEGKAAIVLSLVVRNHKFFIVSEGRGESKKKHSPYWDEIQEVEISTSLQFPLADGTGCSLCILPLTGDDEDFAASRMATLKHSPHNWVCKSVSRSPAVQGFGSLHHSVAVLADPFGGGQYRSQID